MRSAGPAQCELPRVGGESAGVPGGMTDAIVVAEDARTAVLTEHGGPGYDPTYAALPDDTDYDVPPPPPVDRVIPYTATGANPSYPQDAASGFECAPTVEPDPAPAPAAKKAAPEPEVEELNPAGIPAPPD